jgi:hypothetical protein
LLGCGQQARQQERGKLLPTSSKGVVVGTKAGGGTQRAPYLAVAVVLPELCSKGGVRPSTPASKLSSGCFCWLRQATFFGAELLEFK